MTNKQLKNLKDTLWTTADQLRANSGLKSTEYAEPILGLIFLRSADVKYSKFEPEIKAELILPKVLVWSALSTKLLLKNAVFICRKKPDMIGC